MKIFMKNFFKKNQIIVFVIGLMIITAGYLSFANTENNKSLEAGSIIDSEEMAGIGDAKLVSANIADGNVIETNVISDNNDSTNQIEATKKDSNTIGDNNEIESNNTISSKDSENTSSNDKEIQTNANSTDEYFTSSRLDRNTMYSQRIENYQDILSNTNVSEAQKKTAQEEITKINKEQNAIMIAENLIKTKGIEDLVIFVNGESINVIVKGEDLKEEEIAQIQNIVMRELEAEIENIHIMNK